MASRRDYCGMLSENVSDTAGGQATKYYKYVGRPIGRLQSERTMARENQEKAHKGSREGLDVQPEYSQKPNRSWQAGPGRGTGRGAVGGTDKTVSG